MTRFRFRPSVALLAGLALAAPAPARAIEPGPLFDLRDDAHAALSSSITLIRRVLHIGPQEDVVSHAIAVSSREATLDLELANGHTRTLTLRAGRVLVDGQTVGAYAPGGVLDRSWRRALADAASLDTRAVLVALRAWPAASLNPDEAAARTRLLEGLRGLSVRAASASAPAQAEAKLETERAVATAQGGQITIRLEDLSALDTIGRQLQALDEAGTDVADAVRNTPVRLGDVAVAAGQRVDGNVVVYKGNANIFGEVTGNVVALFGDVTYHRGSLIGHNAVSLGGRVINDGGVVRGDIKTISRADLASADAEVQADADLKAAARVRPAPTALDRVSSDVLNVLAVFVALAMLGFGTVFFGRRYVEVVADTASHAFGRSFVVGLLGQLLLLPTFAMLIVGLIFTLVGILLLPFAAVAFVLAAIVAGVGGYLAVAHAIGETVTRRRMAHGAFVRAPNAYGYLFAGLIGLLGLWAAAALTGWMGPIVIVFRIAAVIVTWLAATVGFGAVLLSRAGLRETFAGRHFGEMSDEYLWATPPATPTAARMNQK